MFQKIFVEEHLLIPPLHGKTSIKNSLSNLNHNSKFEKTQAILDYFKQEPILIKKVENYFGRTKKPYLQKRDRLNLYIGEKKGKLVKSAPPAYGFKLNMPHYYFIYSYNCVYECEYCYLQGYFSSPDIVFFINYPDIIQEMQALVDTDPQKEIWFHGGEFSDSLALSHITDEWDLFWDFFQKHPQAKLELRTKSANTKQLKSLTPHKNIIISFSLNPAKIVKQFEHKTPSLKARLHALNQLLNLGYQIGIHLDPIIHCENFENVYEEFVVTLSDVFKSRLYQLEYLSLGTVRYAKKSYREVVSNYPQSPLTRSEMIVGFDQKIRYPRPKRIWMVEWIKSKLITLGLPEKKIYFCMEEDSSD